MADVNPDKQNVENKISDAFDDNPLFISDTAKINILGRVALERGVITPEQLNEACLYIEKQKKAGQMKALQDVLLEKKFVSPDTMMKLIATTIREMNKAFGELAVEKGFLDALYVDNALRIQAEKYKSGELVLLSDLLIKAGLLTEKQRDTLMGIQNETIQNSPLRYKKNGKKVGASPVIRSRLSDISEKSGVPATGLVALEDKIINKEEFDDILGYSMNSNDIVVSVSKDCLNAEVIIPANYRKKVTLETIRQIISEHHFTFGLVPDAFIEECLLSDNSEIRRFIIAKGLPVKFGRDAEIMLNFQREYLNSGKITEEGKIDFKDRGAVPFVSKGDVLLKIIPALTGTPGTDIFGTLLSAPLVSESNVTAGKGAVFSEDGLEITAEEDGQPNITVDGCVSVFQQLTINGDVDYHTGNIIFDGHIIVKGVIKDGFSVTGGALTVQEIDGGLINLKRNLEVSGGILNATIKTEGNIQAMYMGNSIADAYGDVVIKKEIIDSKITTSGACASEKTKIIASSVAAMKGIRAAQIGTDVSEKCTLRVGTNVHAEKEIRIIKKLIRRKTEFLAEKQACLTDLEAQQSEINKKIAVAAQNQDRSELKQKKIKEGLEELQGDQESFKPAEKKSNLISALRKLETEIQGAACLVEDYFNAQEDALTSALLARKECEDLVTEIERQNTVIHQIRLEVEKQGKLPVVTVANCIYPGTIIFGPETSMIIKEKTRNCSVKELTLETDPGHCSCEMKIVPNQSV